MRHRTRRLAFAGVAALIVFVAFWRFAPIEIAADERHTAPVRSLLNGYMHAAVEARAKTVTVPDWFDARDPALVRLGAAHYATGCAGCHGAPGMPRSPVTRGMRPAPTPLAGTDLSAREYYWVARHGLRYTGMPGWPGQGRDDEPWALASFLLAYDDLDPAAYRRLALGREGASESVDAVPFGGLAGLGLGRFETCTRCHGADGLGRDGTAPKLAGQSEAYLVAALDAYAEDRRQSGFMEPVAAALPPETRRNFARNFAGLPGDWQGAAGRGGGDVARGRALALSGDEHAEVPACAACHGAGGDGPRNPAVPRIAGQDARWIALWLRLWRDGPVPRTDGAARMAAAARNLDDAMIADLAAFYAAGAPAEGAAPEPAP